MSDTPRTDEIDYLAPDTDSDPARSWMAAYIDMKNLSMQLERELNARDSCSTGSAQGTPETPAVTPAKPALSLAAMNKTPLTDAEAVRFARIMVDFHAGAKVTELVPADFARNLECKLREDQRIIGDVMDRALTAERDLGYARAEIATYVGAFRHPHVNNGEDDACRQCGLDLRNPIHCRVLGKSI